MNSYALFMGQSASKKISSAKSQSKSIVPFYEFIRESELAPRFLGLQMVLAKSFARIHYQNLINFSILPLIFLEPDDYDRINQGDIWVVKNAHDAIKNSGEVIVYNKTKGQHYAAKNSLTEHQVEIVIAGGLINLLRKQNQ